MQAFLSFGPIQCLYFEECEIWAKCDKKILSSDILTWRIEESFSGLVQVFHEGEEEGGGRLGAEERKEEKSVKWVCCYYPPLPSLPPPPSLPYFHSRSVDAYRMQSPE